MFAHFNRFSIKLTRSQAEQASHQGHCDADVDALCRFPEIRRQLDRIPPEAIAAELKEFGAWDETELANADNNRQKIVWIAAGNITDDIKQAIQ